MQEDITGYQVRYSGTVMNVTGSINILTFTAPSLPDGVFTSTIVVTVAALSRYGIGPLSDPKTTMINGKMML